VKNAVFGFTLHYKSVYCQTNINLFSLPTADHNRLRYAAY